MCELLVYRQNSETKGATFLALKEDKSVEASEVANVIIFMLARPRGMTIRDVVMLPTKFDL